MRFLAIFLFVLLFASPAETGPAVSSREVRVFVITGQGGKITSGGMVQFAHALARVEGLNVSLHSWKYPGQIIKYIRDLPDDMPVVLVGYSLGAHTVTYVSHYLKRRKVALGVLYDPSIYAVPQYQVGENMDRTILFHNNGRSRLGHAYVHGPRLETYEISEGHLSVDWDQRLHQKTFEAIMRVLGEAHGRR